MKYAALITARSGSKGVPNKNIKKLHGVPLLAWSIKACKKSELIEEVFISTDSTEYAQVAIEFGAKAPFIRPKEISNDESTDFQVFKHAINYFESNSIHITNLIHIRPTTPLRNTGIINEAISVFDSNYQNITSLRSVHEMSESAYKTFEINEFGNLESLINKDSLLDSNSPRQNFPKTFSANGYVDIVKTEYIIKNNNLHGDKIHAFITPVVTEIDTPDDFELIEWQVQKNPDFYKSLFGDYK